MHAANLEAWSVTPSNFPASGTLLDKARFAVRYAILAPSSHNTQPWRFVSGDRELLVCADRTRSLPNIDPFDRELIISCGAALFNLRVALAHFLIPVEITPFPYSAEPDVVARIVFPESGAQSAGWSLRRNHEARDQSRPVYRGRCPRACRRASQVGCTGGGPRCRFRPDFKRAGARRKACRGRRPATIRRSSVPSRTCELDTFVAPR